VTKVLFTLSARSLTDAHHVPAPALVEVTGLGHNVRVPNTVDARILIDLKKDVPTVPWPATHRRPNVVNRRYELQDRVTASEPTLAAIAKRGRS
jgi:hypothetical protein